MTGKAFSNHFFPLLDTKYFCHSLITYFFLGSVFSKVATAGQRTAEAALGSICVTTHRLQQTTDIQNTVAKRERQSEGEERDRRVANAQNCPPRIDRG